MAKKRRPKILENWDEVQHDPLSIPPDDFSGMDLDDAVAAIREWFYENFEDPAESTPYESAEGGYQYIWGGPYDTRDIIENVFADTASEELIAAAIAELETDSDVWVPSTSRRQAPEEDEPPDEELDIKALHVQLQERVHSLEEALKRVPQPPAGMGHNRPPEPLEAEPLDENDRKEIATALQTLKAQPVDPQDKGAVAQAALGQIESKRAKLGRWLAQQGQVFTTEAVKEAGKRFGQWAPAAFWLWFMDQMFGLSHVVQKWLSVVHLPF